MIVHILTGWTVNTWRDVPGIPSILPTNKNGNLY